MKYTFDGENRISDVRKLGASTAWANTFAYHPSGAASSLTAGNAMTHGQTFTSRYWPLALNSGAVSLTYQTYDKVGNPKTVVDHAVPVTETFAYDAVDRLETTQGRWGSGSFTYSDDGNRKTKVVAGVTTTYAVSTSTGGWIRSRGPSRTPSPTMQTGTRRRRLQVAARSRTPPRTC